MKYRFLGNSGLQVSELSFGAWVTFGDQMGDDQALACMQEAYDAGVNFFDNAEVYAGGQAEEIMGRVLKQAGWKRSDLVISTKIFWGGKGPNDQGLSRKHIIEGTHAALARMQLEYVDLIFCHRPDYQTPIEETVRAMNYVIDQGYAYYWGTSEWSADQILQAYHIARRERLIPPLMEQPQYNLLHRGRVEVEYLPCYEEFGMGTTIWSPLASGVLTGKYNDGIPKGSRMTLENYQWLKSRLESPEGKANIERARKLEPIAREMGVSMAKMAIAWCLLNSNVSTVITGASKPEQVRENMDAMNILDKFTPEILEKIEAALDNKPRLPTEWKNNR